MVLLYLNPDYKINNRLISIFGEQNTYIKLSEQLCSFETKGGEKKWVVIVTSETYN